MVHYFVRPFSAVITTYFCKDAEYRSKYKFYHILNEKSSFEIKKYELKYVVYKNFTTYDI